MDNEIGNQEKGDVLLRATASFSLDSIDGHV